MEKESLARTISYVSPFEKIDFVKSESYQPFIGTFSQVTDVLKSSLWSKNTSSLITRALHPPRVTRGIMDYFVNTDTDQRMKLPLLQKAVNIGLDVYRQDKTAQRLVSEIEEMENQIRANGLGNLLSYPVIQIKDQPTWDATNPQRSRQTADRLSHSLSSKDILLISLGHGSTAAAMDIFIQLLNGKINSQSVLYPVRLSTKKQRDQQPRLSNEEVLFLKSIAKQKQVVLFDEDIITGNTFNIAMEFFGALFMKHPNSIIQEFNLKIHCDLGEN